MAAFQKLCKCILAVDAALRISNHQNNKRDKEDDGKNDSNAIEVLLYNARTGLVVVHGASNHVANTSALTGMQKNENYQANARSYQQNREDDRNNRQR